jgi:hypothetical protein
MNDIREQIEEIRRYAVAGSYRREAIREQMIEAADTINHLLAVHIAADKFFVRHGIGLDTDEEWNDLSDALDVVNVFAVQKRDVLTD